MSVTKDDIADARRYRYLRDHCSSCYPMTHDQPAEWCIQWAFQQGLPHQAYGSFDQWIDEDIQRQAERDAEDEADDGDRRLMFGDGIDRELVERPT